MMQIGHKISRRKKCPNCPWSFEKFATAVKCTIKYFYLNLQILFEMQELIEKRHVDWLIRKYDPVAAVYHSSLQFHTYLK